MFSQARNIKKKHRLPTSIFHNKTETSAVYLLKLQKRKRKQGRGTQLRVIHNKWHRNNECKIVFKGQLISEQI